MAESPHFAGLEEHLNADAALFRTIPARNKKERVEESEMFACEIQSAQE